MAKNKFTPQLKSVDDIHPSRKNPPAYVSGFRFGTINDGVLVIDFFDIADGKQDISIFSSVALSSHTVSQLMEGLQGFMERNEEG